MSSILPAFQWPLQFCAFVTAATYIASVVTGNVSQVDRVWTFLPTIYAAYFALLPLWPYAQTVVLQPYVPKDVGFGAVQDFSPRALLMLGLIVTWMFRLSYNTYRRGLFSLQDEDYRWAILRKQLSPILFQIFNLGFVAIIQNLLLLGLGVPVQTASVYQPHTSLEMTDYALGAFALTLLALEFTSDNQQYAFQTFKYDYLAKEAKAKGETLTPTQLKAESYDEAKQWPGARLAWTGDDAHRGFITKGLWGYVRHPNFVCEQSFWWVITVFPIVASPPPNVTSNELNSIIPGLVQALKEKSSDLALQAIQPLGPLSPAIALSILFISSTLFTEKITASKYPEAYAAYQERVGMFSWSWAKALIVRLSGRQEEIENLVWGPVKTKKE